MPVLRLVRRRLPSFSMPLRRLSWTLANGSFPPAGLLMSAAERDAEYPAAPHHRAVAPGHCPAQEALGGRPAQAGPVAHSLNEARGPMSSLIKASG